MRAVISVRSVGGGPWYGLGVDTFPFSRSVTLHPRGAGKPGARTPGQAQSALEGTVLAARGASIQSHSVLSARQRSSGNSCPLGNRKARRHGRRLLQRSAHLGSPRTASHCWSQHPQPWSSASSSCLVRCGCTWEGIRPHACAPRRSGAACAAAGSARHPATPSVPTHSHGGRGGPMRQEPGPSAGRAPHVGGGRSRGEGRRGQSRGAMRSGRCRRAMGQRATQQHRAVRAATRAAPPGPPPPLPRARAPCSIPGPAPCVSYSGSYGGAEVHLVWNGRDAEHGVDLVGTVPAALSTYLALQARAPGSGMRSAAQRAAPGRPRGQRAAKGRRVWGRWARAGCCEARVVCEGLACMAAACSVRSSQYATRCQRARCCPRPCRRGRMQT